MPAEKLRDDRWEKFVNAEVMEVVLEKTLVRNQRFIDPGFIEPTLKLRVLEGIASELVMELSAYVWSEQLPKTTVTYPADWWEAFKERWFDTKNNWFWKRHPVKYRTVVFDPKVFAPRLREFRPEDKLPLHCVRFDTTT